MTRDNSSVAPGNSIAAAFQLAQIKQMIAKHRHAPPVRDSRSHRLTEIHQASNGVTLGVSPAAFPLLERTKRLPVFYKIDKERRVVMTTGSGAFTLADALRHQDSLLQDPDFDPSYSQIMDVTHVTRFDVDAGDIRKLAQRTIFSPQSRRAIIVSTDLAYGYGRMFELFREGFGETGIRVFRTLEEALDWVLSKDISA
jgi:hypothetical protein